MAEIIRNVYKFGRILSQAGTQRLQYWDDRSLENAFNWARYCEKVEAQTCGKSYRDQLDCQLQSLTLLLSPVTLLDLSLDRLKHATGYLGKVLLTNPSLPDSLKKAVQRHIETSNKEETETVLREKLSRLKSRSLSYLLGNDSAIPDTTEGQAVFIMQRLVRLKKVSASKERFCYFLEEFLKTLMAESDCWEIVLYMLVSEIESDDGHWQTEEIKADVLKFVSTQSSLRCSLWQVEPNLLCEVCSQDDQFYRIYQQYLLYWAGCMEPVYGLTDQGDLYQWCYKGEELETKCSCDCVDHRSERHCLCFNSLVRHVCCLFEHQRKKKDHFENSVRELSKQSHFNVWKDVLRSVKERIG